MLRETFPIIIIVLIVSALQNENFRNYLLTREVFNLLRQKGPRNGQTENCQYVYEQPLIQVYLPGLFSASLSCYQCTKCYEVTPFSFKTFLKFIYVCIFYSMRSRFLFRSQCCPFLFSNTDICNFSHLFSSITQIFISSRFSFLQFL